MEERCSRCFRVVPLGANDRRPPWCPHCGADFVPAPPLPSGLSPEPAGDPLTEPVLSRPPAKGPVNIFAVVVTVLVGAALLSMVKDWVNTDPEKEFRESQLTQLRSLRENPPTEIAFTSLDQKVVVTDPDEIKAFLEILCEAKNVHPHHSHPVGMVVVTIPGLPETYFLGQDSANEHEHWFKMQQPEHPGADSARRVVQFQSAEMTAWLQRTKVAGLQR